MRERAGDSTKLVLYGFDTLPENLYLSPEVIFLKWNECLLINGEDLANNSNKKEFKVLRELLVAATYATFKREVSGGQYWVGRVEKDPPDAIVLGDDMSEKRRLTSKHLLEITERDLYSKDIYEVLNKKYKKRYEPGTEIVLRVRRMSDGHEEIDFDRLKAFDEELNRYGIEVWIIGQLDDDHSDSYNLVMSRVKSGKHLVLDFKKDAIKANTSGIKVLEPGLSADPKLKLDNHNIDIIVPVE